MGECRPFWISAAVKVRQHVAEYVALLRGIGPTNPNMRNERLRAVFEGLGFKNVRTVISTGNVVFESDSTDTASMEATLETAWQEKLGFTSTTIIRSIEDVAALVEMDPYQGLEHGPASYLLVTFFKQRPAFDFEFPLEPPDRPYRLVGRSDREVFSLTDTTGAGASDLMAWLERQFGKEISSRTWATVHRIIKKSSTAF